MLSKVASRELIYRSNYFKKFGSYTKPSKTLSVYALKHYAKRTVQSLIFGACVIDGYNEFTICRSISRFMRSLKIAAVVSLDYTWNLYGLENETEKFEQVGQFIIESALNFVWIPKVVFAHF